ncbi:MAG: hypothetical protein HY867_09710 [Chloroflexi bacterium]|nr:hypothetical protein [Chloroflexota bacterium]
MRRFIVWVRDRFPSTREWMPVYAMGLSILNFWMLGHFSWKLSGWVYFQRVSDLLVTLAYSFATTFLESAAVIFGIVLLAAILPRLWFGEAFVARGATLVLLGLGYVMFFAFQFQSKTDYPTAMVNITPWALAGICALAYFAGRVPLARRILESLADRFLIFLYIFLPLGILGLVTMILRNLG